MTSEPIVLWLAGLHIPETYLAALVQMACRRNSWSLDRSAMYTAVSRYTIPEHIEERPDEVIDSVFLTIFISFPNFQNKNLVRFYSY